MSLASARDGHRVVPRMHMHGGSRMHQTTSRRWPGRGTIVVWILVCLSLLSHSGPSRSSCPLLFTHGASIVAPAESWTGKCQQHCGAGCSIATSEDYTCSPSGYNNQAEIYCRSAAGVSQGPYLHTFNGALCRPTASNPWSKFNGLCSSGTCVPRPSSSSTDYGCTVLQCQNGGLGGCGFAQDSSSTMHEYCYCMHGSAFGDGPDCSVPKTDWPLLLNAESTTLTSSKSAPVRLKIRVSPSNTALRLVIAVHPVWCDGQLRPARDCAGSSLHFYVSRGSEHWSAPSWKVDPSTATVRFVTEDIGAPFLRTGSSAGVNFGSYAGKVALATADADTNEIEWELISNTRGMVTGNDHAYISIVPDVPLNGSWAGGGSRLPFGSDPKLDVSMTITISMSDSVAALAVYVAVGVLSSFILCCACCCCYARAKHGSVSQGCMAGPCKPFGDDQVKSRAGFRSAVQPDTSAMDALDGNPALSSVAVAMWSATQSTRVVDACPIIGDRPLSIAEIHAKSYEPDPEPSGCVKALRVVLGVVMFIVAVIVSIIQMLFNLSLLQQSITFVRGVDFDGVVASVTHALRKLPYVGQLADVFVGFSSSWRSANEGVSAFSLAWNCGGAVSLVGPVLMCVCAFLMMLTLQKDLFLKFALGMRGADVKHGYVRRRLRHACGKFTGILMLYVLQSYILLMATVVAALWSVQGSCSAEDQRVLAFGRVFAFASVVMTGYAGLLFFAGMRDFTFRALTLDWISGVLSLILVSFGGWTGLTVQRFDVQRRARRFTQSSSRFDENPDEALLELQGASRGLVWCIFPLGIILSKFAEQVNLPPVFLCCDVDSTMLLTTPVWNRFLRWLVGMLKLVLMFAVMYRGDDKTINALVLVTIIGVMFDFALPSQYYRKKLAVLKAQQDQDSNNKGTDAIQIEMARRDASRSPFTDAAPHAAAAAGLFGSDSSGFRSRTPASLSHVAVAGTASPMMVRDSAAPAGMGPRQQ